MFPKKQIRLSELPNGAFFKRPVFYGNDLYQVTKQYMGYKKEDGEIPHDVDGKIIRDIFKTKAIYGSRYSDIWNERTFADSDQIFVMQWVATPEEEDKFSEAVIEEQTSIDDGE